MSEKTTVMADRYTLGDAIRRSYLKHGNDSWCSIADDVLAELSVENEAKSTEPPVELDSERQSGEQ